MCSPLKQQVLLLDDSYFQYLIWRAVCPTPSKTLRGIHHPTKRESTYSLQMNWSTENQKEIEKRLQELRKKLEFREIAVQIIASAQAEDIPIEIAQT